MSKQWIQTRNFKDGNTSPGLNEYEYDENGNMVKDRNKGITNITYNHLNLPVRITISSLQFIDYQYNAAGVKVSKTVTDNAEIKKVDYQDGFQSRKLSGAGEVLQFFPTAEGYVSAIPNVQLGSGVITGYTYKHIFHYTDHLGNVRLSFSTRSNGRLEVMNENHYYPFGMKHSIYVPGGKKIFGLNPGEEELKIKVVTKTEYLYEYNGKEFQDELGLAMYDFGFRDYDPALGRWNVVDQLSEMYQSISPYAYVANNPLINREIDGRYFEKGSKSERQAARIERRAENRANRLERRADRLDAKGKSTGDLRDRAGELRQTAQDVKDMRGDSSTEYRYASVNGKQAKSLGVEGPATVGTGTNPAGDQVVTMFTEKNMGNQIHENRHGGQHFRGEIDAVNQVSSVNAEVSAYRAQYSWGGSLKLPTLDVNSIGDIVNFQTNMLNRVLLDSGNFPPQVNTTNITNIGQINRSLIQNIVEVGVAGGTGPLPTVQNYLLWIYAPLP